MNCSQIRELLEDNPELHKELLQVISKLRDEEEEHQETGLRHNAKAVCQWVNCHNIRVDQKH